MSFKQTNQQWYNAVFFNHLCTKKHIMQKGTEETRVTVKYRNNNIDILSKKQRRFSFNWKNYKNFQLKFKNKSRLVFLFQTFILGMQASGSNGKNFRFGYSNQYKSNSISILQVVYNFLAFDIMKGTISCCPISLIQRDWSICT